MTFSNFALPSSNEDMNGVDHNPENSSSKLALHQKLWLFEILLTSAKKTNSGFPRFSKAISLTKQQYTLIHFTYAISTAKGLVKPNEKSLALCNCCAIKLIIFYTDEVDEVPELKFAECMDKQKHFLATK